MNELRTLQIPRHVICNQPKDVQLHGFCDSSQLAYGAAIYIRSTDREGNHYINLLCAKSRVAPLKVVSLPRLELCGALLLARLTKAVIEAVDMNFSRLQYWCDSSIVLAWIAGEPVQWNSFVANRTSEIQKLTQGHRWNHVSSESNPADVISRGMDCDQLIRCELWWHGPDWLREDECVWPKPKYLNSETIPERRIIHHSLAINVLNCDLFEKYSSLLKLQRVTAFCLRFGKNCSQ